VVVDEPAARAKPVREPLALGLVLDDDAAVLQALVLLVQDPHQVVDVARRPRDVQLVVDPDARPGRVEQQDAERVLLGALRRAGQQPALHLQRAVEVVTVSRRRRHRRRPRRRGG
jgi:hypothetical protein